MGINQISHSSLQASGSNDQHRARVGTSASPWAHNNNAALLVNRAVADSRGLLPAARLFTIYFENVPHLKAVDAWEMGHIKMEGQ